MKYTKVAFTIQPFSETNNEILIAELSELAFDSFEETTVGINAYIPTTEYNEEDIKSLFLLNNADYKITYLAEDLEDQNWNETWEQHYFEPIIIEDECIVRSPFHKEVPSAEYNILIEPKMAFGTGHHETTGLMIKHILETDFSNQTVLDMGCGTAILGILTAMKGAKNIVGIDIEEWAYHNAIENCKLNNIDNMTIKHGDASAIGDAKYDIILANINRNILLEDISKYRLALNENGLLLLSGFYTQDLQTIDNECSNHKLNKISVKEDNNWVAVSYRAVKG